MTSASDRTVNMVKNALCASGPTENLCIFHTALRGGRRGPACVTNRTSAGPSHKVTFTT